MLRAVARADRVDSIPTLADFSAWVEVLKVVFPKSSCWVFGRLLGLKLAHNRRLVA